MTAETAVALPLIALFAVSMAWLVSIGITQVRALDAARETARAAARSDGAGEATVARASGRSRRFADQREPVRRHRRRHGEQPGQRSGRAVRPVGRVPRPAEAVAAEEPIVVTRPAVGEDGAGSVLAVAMLGVLVTVTVAAAGVVGVVATHRAAQAAADLAALAGASALQDGGDACAAGVGGRATATRPPDRLRREEWDVLVVVVADTARLPGGVLDLRARGRAGPAVSAPGR